MAKEKEQKVLKYADIIAQQKKKGVISDISKIDNTTQILTYDSPTLNYVYGGFPVGRITEIWGPFSSAKSALMTSMVPMINRQPTANRVLYMDFEHTFDKRYAKIHNIDFDSPDSKFIYMDPLGGEEAFDTWEQLLMTGEIGMTIVDSIPAIPTRSVLTDEIGKQHISPIARFLGMNMPRFNAFVSKYKSSLVFINQIRSKIGGFSPNPNAENVPGGFAVGFAASIRTRVSKIEDMTEAGIVNGLKIKVKNKKNKVSIPHREGEMILNFEKGFDLDWEYARYIVDLEMVNKEGSWFSNDDWKMKVQGKNEIMPFLRKDKDLYKQVTNTVNAKLLTHNQLDTAIGDTVIGDEDSYDELEGEA